MADGTPIPPDSQSASNPKGLEAELVKLVDDKVGELRNQLTSLTSAVGKDIGELQSKLAVKAAKEAGAPQPTVGRVVLFCEDLTITGKAQEVLPAVITKVHGPTNVDLHVLGYANTDFAIRTGVLLGDDKTRRTWSWPPKK